MRSIARTSIATIQPVHELTGIVPDGHGKNHTATECFAHLCKSATLLERRSHDLAEGLFNRVDAHTGNLNDSILNDLVVLDVEASDVAERASGSTIICVELRDYSEGLKKGISERLCNRLININLPCSC